MPLRLRPTFRDALARGDRSLAGIWVCSGSPLVAEICAGAGLDWVLIDMEHSPNGLESVLAQLQAVAAYPVTPVVRVPIGDVVMIKQVLDLGAQSILVPMVSSKADAEAAVAAVRYPPRGARGVGSALARSARWNRVDGYLTDADEHVSLFVQIETSAGVEAAAEIAAVDGVDGVFVGPSDLAASMGLLGQQTHPDVVAAVLRAFDAVRGVGKPVGVNAFDPAAADSYIAAGASFVLVGADVALLARGSEALAARFIPAGDNGERASYWSADDGRRHCWNAARAPDRECGATELGFR
ncbi:MAG: aldolase/citrate lyase family protein [Microbacterium sp.]|nr:aldolase/citrate lyase family protein [Microbacterium sp.]